MIWRHWGCHPLPTKNPQVFVKLWGARRDRGHCGGAPGRRDDRVGRGATGIHAGTQSAPGAATVSIHRALEALEGMKPGPVGRFLLGRGFIVLTGTMIVKHKCIYMYIYICVYIYIHTRLCTGICVYVLKYIYVCDGLLSLKSPCFRLKMARILQTRCRWWRSEPIGTASSRGIRSLVPSFCTAVVARGYLDNDQLSLLWIGLLG